MAVEFKKHILSNGLTVVAEVMDEAHSAAAGFFVKTGARDEASDVMGVSHFLQHMMFKGTADLSAEAINQGFDALGARHNAFTTNEMTCFYAKVLPDVLDDTLSLLGQMMRPALRNDDFVTEKQVILEEIAMYRDNPFWKLYEETTQRLFEPHPLAHRVLGTDQTITDLQRDAMAAYFADRYSADNTTLALAGKLDFDRCIELIEQTCSSWDTTKPARDTSPPPTGKLEFVMHDEQVHRAYLLGLGIGPSVQDDRRYAASIAASLLGMPENSRLHWALIETGIADEAQAAYEPHDGIGEFFVYCSCAPESADKVWQIVEQEVNALGSNIEQDDLERLRAKIATGATIGAERPMDRMLRLGRVWLASGEYRSLDDELAAIERVTTDDVREVIESSAPLLRTCGRLMPEPASV